MFGLKCFDVQFQFFLELALPSRYPGRRGGTLEAGAEEGRDEQRGSLRRADSEVLSHDQSGTWSK